MSTKLPSKEYLNECFHYLEDGTLIRKARPRSHFKTDVQHKSSTFFEGRKAKGKLINSGYLIISFTYEQKKIDLLAHRIIWTMHFGEIPEGIQIDHKDTIKLNNQIGNLRLASFSNNAHNANTRKDNTSGIKGVSWNKTAKLWEARLCVNSKRVHLGYYKIAEDAEIAIRAARLQIHGEFTNHGIT